jgi:hypothetical protein
MKKVWFPPAMANGQWALSKTVGVHATFKLTSEGVAKIYFVADKDLIRCSPVVFNPKAFGQMIHWHRFGLARKIQPRIGSIH